MSNCLFWPLRRAVNVAQRQIDSTHEVIPRPCSICRNERLIQLGFCVRIAAEPKQRLPKSGSRLEAKLGLAETRNLGQRPLQNALRLGELSLLFVAERLKDQRLGGFRRSRAKRPTGDRMSAPRGGA